MLMKLDDHLFVGDQRECQWLGNERPFVAVVHACKHPCHVKLLDYKGALPKEHPEYLVASRGSHLFLNQVDAPEARWFRMEPFTAALDFLDEWVPKGSVLCHCNSGLSRAPSIAMLWLAKRAKAFLGDSYPEAKAVFTRIMPGYSPGKGIEAFMAERWEEVG